MWFLGGIEVDNEIRTRFQHLIDEALSGGLRDWENNARSCLAKIIILDQFTRNVFRGTKEAFSGADEAERIARLALQQYYSEYSPLERHWIILVFSHSENVKDQELAEKLAIENIELAKNGPFAAFVSNAYDFAMQHKAIIDQFGRYPHRNLVLGRTSTPQELEYLKDGPRFGQ